MGREHLLLRFAREFTHFFALILWLGAALAFFAESFDPGQGMARLGVAIVGVILINGVFSFWQEYRAERAVAALRELLPQQVMVSRDGEIVEMLASELVPGDIVLLEEGDFVPADCRLIEAFGLRVNTATVTGESLPRACNADPHPEVSPLFAENIVLAGTASPAAEVRRLARDCSAVRLWICTGDERGWLLNQHSAAPANSGHRLISPCRATPGRPRSGPRRPSVSPSSRKRG